MVDIVVKSLADLHVQSVFALLTVHALAYALSAWLGALFVPSLDFVIWSSLGVCIFTLLTTFGQLKRLWSVCCAFCLGLNINPLVTDILGTNSSILFEALLGTCLIFLTIYFYVANNPQFRGTFTVYGAFLNSCLMLLIYGSLLVIITKSDTLDTIVLVSGLALFSGLVASDVDRMLVRAKSQPYTTKQERELYIVYDAFSLFLDAVNLFVHLLRLLQKLRKNNK